MYTPSATMQAAIAAGNPQRFLLVFEDGTEFSNEEISSDAGVQYHAEFNASRDLTIGLTPSAYLSFTLLNDDRDLTDFEFGTFRAYIGIQITSGTPAAGAVTRTYDGELYEFAPLGVFIAERPDIVNVDSVQVTSYDQMSLFDVDMPSAADLGITYSASLTMYDLLSAMCDYVGVTLKNDSILNGTEIKIASRPKKFDNATMQDVLRWIAEASCSIARFTRDGELEMAWFTQTPKTYTESGYSDFSPSWYEVSEITALKVRNESNTSESLVGTEGNDYVIMGNPFLG